MITTSLDARTALTGTSNPQLILQVALAALSEGKISEVVDQFDDHFTFVDHALTLEFADKGRLTEFFQKARELFPDTVLEVGNRGVGVRMSRGRISLDHPKTHTAIPEVICFRITRNCNARCGFCLAPPDGPQPDTAVLVQRINWLRSRGVKRIHFCGGEPTIHPELGNLIEYVHAVGGKSLLTTNAIAIQDDLISILRTHHTRVKVSLHGDQSHHDRIVGCKAFSSTTGNLRRLLAAAVPTSVQTTIVSGGEWVVDWVADFCRGIGVRTLSILPFIPRGNGYHHRQQYELSNADRCRLHELVRKKRKALAGILDIRWLDFASRPVMVAEASGRLVLEGATDASDQIICEMPSSRRGLVAIAEPDPI